MTTDTGIVAEEIEELPEEIEEFSVVLQNSHNDTYHPGQMVEGHLLVHLSQPFMTRGVLIHFRGFAEIFWSQYTRGQGARCIDKLDFSAHEDFFNINTLVQDAGYLPPGITKFPFKFHLTPPLPETYEDNLCQIAYYVEGRLKRDNNRESDITDTRNILLLSPLDLNVVILPDVTLPVFTQQTATFCCCCCRSQPITAFLRLSRSGYAPGDTIHVQADIENLSRRSIRYTEFRLVEISVYSTPEKVHENREVMISVREGSVKSGETKEWTDIPLYIPKQQLYNVNASKIFAIHHVLEMEVHPWLSVKHLLLSLDLTLGAVPLEGAVIDKPAHLRLHGPSDVGNFKGAVSLQQNTDVAPRGNTWKKYDPARLRRGVRERKVLPLSDVTDTTGYVKPKKKPFR